MKKTLSMLIVLILLLGVLPVANFAPVAQAAAPGTYNTGDIAVINAMIDNNGLSYPKAPEDGSSVPDKWNKVKWSDVSENKRIIKFDVYSKGLTGSLDLSGLDELKDLGFQNNKITALDVGENTRLEALYFYDNQIKELDVSKNTELISLQCGRNQLTKLDVSKNTKLKNLWCSKNQITALDISKNTKLEWLDFEKNELTELNVSKNTKLELLHCAGNKLDKLNVSKNTELKFLYCAGNNLTKLNVSNNTQLESLYCAGNRLTKLDISKNTKLEEFNCGSNTYGGNQLAKLDVSKNTKLVRLKCPDNQLTKLDVSKNTKLTDLYCAHNYMPSSNSLIGWKKIKNLKWFNYNPQQDSGVSGQSIKLSPSSKKLTVGGKILLTAKVSPTNTTSVNWKSSKKSVAVVDYDGHVTAKAPGKTTITVKTEDSGKTATCVITVKPKKTKSVKAKVVSATGAKISWGKVAGVTGHQVRRSTSKNGTYKAVKSTAETSFTNTKLKAGQTYYYKVRAYKTVDGQKIYGKESSIVSVTPKPLKVTGVKATKAASGQAKISWSKQANVSGYQVVRATSENGTYYSVATTGKLTCINKNLTAGKTYYYKVRAYKTVSGKRVYGAYSNVKSVKV